MNETKNNIHFHIRWSGNDNLDWECFDTRETAHERAMYLKRQGETFHIEEVRDECSLRQKFA